MATYNDDLDNSIASLDEPVQEQVTDLINELSFELGLITEHVFLARIRKILEVALNNGQYMTTDTKVFAAELGNHFKSLKIAIEG